MESMSTCIRSKAKSQYLRTYVHIWVYFLFRLCGQRQLVFAPVLLPAVGRTAMGSLGWAFDHRSGGARCFWCWRWEWNMYIPDPVGRPLCGDCLDSFCEGHRPPWQPDAIGRTAGLLAMTFRPATPSIGPEVCERIAAFLEPSWMP